jgi:hypothetical protein
MSTNEITVKLDDRKVVFSTLWVFLSLNYIYCDHLAFMEPDFIQNLLSGHIGSIAVTPEFLLSGAVLLEIPFLMVVLSRVLSYRANRWANIIAGAIMCAVQVGTLGIGTAPSPVYLLYSAIEIVCNILIVWLAWKWRNPQMIPVPFVLEQQETASNA